MVCSFREADVNESPVRFLRRQKRCLCGYQDKAAIPVCEIAGAGEKS
jgi:hypothetical protein